MENKNEEETLIMEFNYKNIVEEYFLDTGDISLYQKVSPNEKELIYEKIPLSINVYTLNDVFIHSGYEDNNSSTLTHFSKSNFIKYSNKIGNPNINNPFTFELSKLKSGYLINQYATIYKMSDKDKYSMEHRHIIDRYRKVFNRYSCSSMLLPSHQIINDSLELIHKYVITGNLDLDKLQILTYELQFFCESCPDSFHSLFDFISNPSATDLRVLCDTLERNLHNIDNLLDIYLEDELSSSKEGER